MLSNKHKWLLSTLSVCTAGLMLASPIAWAEDGHGDHGRDGGDRGRDNGAVVVQIRDQHDDRDNDIENENENEVENPNAVNVVNANREMAATNALLAAAQTELANLNNATLTNANDLDDEDEMELEVEHVNSVSLANLVSGLTTADQAAVMTAFNNNAAAVQQFLAGTSANAMTLNQLLMAAGINRASVVGVLIREERVTFITS